MSNHSPKQLYTKKFQRKNSQFVKLESRVQYRSSNSSYPVPPPERTHTQHHVARTTQFFLIIFPLHPRTPCSLQEKLHTTKRRNHRENTLRKWPNINMILVFNTEFFARSPWIWFLDCTQKSQWETPRNPRARLLIIIFPCMNPQLTPPR